MKDNFLFGKRNNTKGKKKQRMQVFERNILG